MKFDMLDIRTITLFNSFLTLMAGFVMLYFSNTQKTYPGFKKWTIAIMISGSGYVLIGLRHILPDLFTIVLANFCIVLSWVIIKDGISDFFGVGLKRRFEFIIFIFFGVIFFYFSLIQPNLPARSIIKIGYLFYLVNSCGLLVYKESKSLFDKSRLMLPFLFVGLGILLISLVGVFYWGGLQDADYMKVGAVNCILTMTIYTLIISIYFGLISLNSDRLSVDLKTSMAEIKLLKGILPICSYCKKIRDDKGYWNQIESYIRNHSEAEFSHGICQECAEKHHPGMDLYDE